jgi:hypothetical protein
LQAAAEVSESPRRPARKVIDRKRLWEGGTVSLSVPVKRFVTHHQLEVGGEKLDYIQFGLPVRGGVINVYVHAENAIDYAGKKVVGMLEVWEKEMEGGARFLYLNLRPDPGVVNPTNRLTIVQGPCPERYKTGPYHEGQGAIVLSTIQSS